MHIEEVSQPSQPVVEKPRVAKTTEYLRYDFSQEEFVDHARLLGRLTQFRMLPAPEKPQ